MSLPLYERINLIAKSLTRSLQEDDDDLVRDGIISLYAIAKETQEKGAHSNYNVELAVFSVLQASPLARDWAYDDRGALSREVTARLKLYEENGGAS